MKHILKFISIIILIVTHTSCVDQVATSSGGREGEVVVVLNQKFQKTAAGKIIDTVLRAPYEVLPQYEPMFKLYVIPWQSFSNTFRAFRNIIKITISNSVAKNKISVKQTKNQMVIIVKAKTESDFVNLFKKERDQIINLLSYSEKNFAQYKISKGIDKHLNKYMLKKHNLNVKFPKGYQVRLDTNNFVWASYETKELSIGCFIYYYPYKDTNTFTKNYLLHKQDSLTKLFIKGPLGDKVDSYMTTQYEYMPPIYKQLMVDKKFYAETRGLWHVTKDFMGGPFINITRLDKKNNRVITFNGYIYYPNHKKRRYMRMLEAIGYSIKVPPKNKTK